MFIVFVPFHTRYKLEYLGARNNEDKVKLENKLSEAKSSENFYQTVGSAIGASISIVATADLLGLLAVGTGLLGSATYGLVKKIQVIF